MRPLDVTSAAAVSSQLDSRPRIRLIPATLSPGGQGEGRTDRHCGAALSILAERRMERPLRLGTRGSPLALAQARLVADTLCTAHGWAFDAITIVPITTTGDMIQDRPLAEVGG